MNKLLTAAIALGAMALSTSANAAVLWNWSFAGEIGTFTTDGTATGNLAAAGAYNFTDFAVTSSAFGRAIGSVSGGQYVAAGFLTKLTYNFNWNGSTVTFWDSAGTNNWNWWVFQEASSPNNYQLFGYAPDTGNDLTSAALFSGATQSWGAISVNVGGAVSPVPEPATWGMMLVGFGIVGGAMRRRQRTSVSFA